MGITICTMVFACGVILNGIQVQFNAREHKVWGFIIGGLAVITAGILNGFPFIVAVCNFIPWK